MTTDYDVIIIGAGPAGASCAKHLVENKIKTLIVERKKIPRYKCCCGLISNRAMEFIYSNFGDIPENIYCENKSIKVKLSKSGKVFFDLPNHEFKNIYRDKFDDWLIKTSSAELMDNCSFIDFKREDNYLFVKLKKEGELKEFKCKYLIGADGANSSVRKKIDSDFCPENLGKTIQHIYKGNFEQINEKYLYISYNKKFSDKGYAWMMKKDNLLYIGTGWHIKNITFLKNWIDVIFNVNKIDNVKLLRKEGGFVSGYYLIDKNLNFGNEDALLCGESSGLISAFFEGVPSSLISGKNAALSIIQYIGKNSCLEQYQMMMKAEITLVDSMWENRDFFSLF